MFDELVDEANLQIKSVLFKGFLTKAVSTPLTT